MTRKTPRKTGTDTRFTETRRIRSLEKEYTSPRAGPIDMVEHYFGEHGWGFEPTGDDEIVANVQGSWAGYELRAVWRVEDRVLQFLALPDIRVPSDKRITIYETIGLINEIGSASCRESVCQYV